MSALQSMSAAQAMKVIEETLREKERIYGDLCADAVRQSSAGVIWGKNQLTLEMQALALALDALRGKVVP